MYKIRPGQTQKNRAALGILMRDSFPKESQESKKVFRKGDPLKKHEKEESICIHRQEKKSRLQRLR